MGVRITGKNSATMNIKFKKLFNVSQLGAAVTAVALLSSCNGMFSGIYDNEDESTKFDTDYGFIGAGDDGSMRIYIDASSYTVWNYLDLHNRRAVSEEIGGEENTEPEKWDFAVHRYDTKTNSGRVMATSLTSLAQAASLTSAPAGEWTEDIWTTNKITVDMSHMMDGYLVYDESFYNPTLSGWLNVDTSSMPPSYSMSDRVYLLELADGTHAAIKLVNYMYNAGVKGFMTIDYIYPLKF